MSIRHVLAARIRELMDSRVTLDTQTKLANKSGVGQSTIQRILAAEASATIDTVEVIAQAFGVPPVTLLSNSAKDEKLFSLWCQLNETDRARMLSFAQVAIESQRHDAEIEFSRSKPLTAGAVERIREATSFPPQSDSTPDTESSNAKRTGRKR